MTKDQNGTTYTYDAWNRMVYASTGTANETFGYLAGGQRASVAVSGSAVDYSFFNAAWQEVELDNNTGPSGSAAMQDTYVWGLANINELVARDDSSSNRLYVQQDANWDMTALVSKVSGTWQVVERFSYSPYGVATVLNASWASTTDSHSWVYRYQAGKYDSLTGLDNFRNRDYSPTLGQWIEADPAGYVQGANLYEANLGAPISHVDPYGMTSGTGSEGDGNNIVTQQDPFDPVNTHTTYASQPTTQPATTPYEDNPPTKADINQELDFIRGILQAIESNIISDANTGNLPALNNDVAAQQFFLDWETDLVKQLQTAPDGPPTTQPATQPTTQPNPNLGTKPSGPDASGSVGTG